MFRVSSLVPAYSKGSGLFRSRANERNPLSVETFADKLGRLAVIAATEQPLPRELGEWAHAHLQDLAALRGWRESLPLFVAKALRDRRILTAHAVIDPAAPWPAARTLFEEAMKIQSRRAPWPIGGDPAPTSLRGALQVAHSWYPLPDCERTFHRLLTKAPLVCQPLPAPIDP